MKLALHETAYGCLLALECWEHRDEEDYSRTSEWVEVYFPDRDRAEVTRDKVASIDFKIEEARANYLTLLNDLEERKSKLMAITHEVTT